MFVIPRDQALYCADPDAVSECIKICAAADVSAIGESERARRRGFLGAWAPFDVSSHRLRGVERFQMMS